MATSRVEEAYSERTEKVNALGDIVEIEIHYLVFEAADEDAALAAARTKAKSKTVTGMTLESVEVEERVNSTTWRVKAEFASSDSSGGDDGGGDEEDSFSTSFDTGGGTMHLNQSLGTSAKAPNDAPDFGGAIGVDGGGLRREGLPRRRLQHTRNIGRLPMEKVHQGEAVSIKAATWARTTSSTPATSRRSRARSGRGSG